jgi:hypothetical protein
MPLRYSLPRVPKRGYGLGNELIPWARAHLAAQVLDATLLPPAFGLNRRPYWRHFGTPADDWIYHRALPKIFPAVEFNEADYLEHGGGDVVNALRAFAVAHRLHERSMYVLVTQGMWGGFHHIMAAREFVRATLYSSRYAARNLLQLRARIDPHKILVAMHVRLGDFAPSRPAGEYASSWNVSLPIEWFCSIAAELRRTYADRWQLLVVSDGTPEQLQPLIGAFPCIITADLAHGDCSDVLALASADLLVCSTSTYSLLAAFLSAAPYLLFAPNLRSHAAGCYTLGDAPDESSKYDPHQIAIRHFLGEGTAVRARGAGIAIDGRLPSRVLEEAERHHRYGRWESDLVRGGAAPVAPGAGGQ